MMLVTFFSLQTPAYLYLYSLSFLFLVLNLFFPIMMSFCKKSVHSFLGLTSTSNMDTSTNTNPSNTNDHHIHHEHNNNKLIPPWKLSQTNGGLGTLVTSTDDNMITRRRLPNVLESTSSTKSSSSSSSSSPPPPPRKKDPNRGIGFIDDIGGGVNGLMSCTESLGFESSDERRVDDEDDIDNVVVADDDELTLTVKPWSTTKVKCRGRRSDHYEVKKFPPPLSSLNQNGQPSFFLRPVRKDGRLELTEVRIHRPEILKAYREDGRLRLHLIRDDDEEEEDNIDEEEQEKEMIKEEDEEEQEKEMIKEEEEEEKEEEGDDQKMKFPLSGGEGFRRCHELVNHHHHHHHHQQHQQNLHVWRQHCVTTT